jgi:predicted porin
MKKQTLSTFIALATLLPAGAMAEISIYGKANVSFEMVNDGEESFTELLSNASRIGFKGSEKINDNLEAIYQLEYETYFDDGDVNGDRTFGQRNIFVGVKGGFGQVIGGNFDTPLKSIQGKVDVFNDLRGDIGRMITTNETRTSDSVMYSTPSLGGFAAHASYISSEEDEVDDGKSAAVSFTVGGLYLGAAFEQDVAPLDSETMRAVATFTIGGLQLGALYEQDELDGADDSLDGWITSILYDFKNKWVIKGQYGESDMRFEGGDAASVGIDFKATNNFTVYSFYTMNSSDDRIEVEDAEEVTVAGVDQDYVAVGVDLKF